MKFPKPKMLTENEYPDSTLSQPELFRKLVKDVIHPPEGSKMSKYYQKTIDFLKDQKKARAKKASSKVTRVNFTALGKALYFAKCITWGVNPLESITFSALVDTGAANSMIHISLVNRLQLAYKPIQLTLATATGLDDNAIKGVLHLKFALATGQNDKIVCCANFVVTTRLNNLACIIGAEFLFDDDRVKSISKDRVTFQTSELTRSVPILPDASGHKFDLTPSKFDPTSQRTVNMLCKDCGNSRGPKKPELKLQKVVKVSHMVWQTPRENWSAEQPSVEKSQQAGEPTDLWFDASQEPQKSDTTNATSHSPSDGEKPPGADPDSDTEFDEWFEPAESLEQLEVENNQSWLEHPELGLSVNAHSIKGTYRNETLPPSEQMFEDTLELKFEVLDKKLSIHDADFSECPAEQMPKIIAL